ncbi:MAG: ABC transporter ATP-binding protein [Anaerolineales bacterium]|nr:ABC transporter ATP-binding protein [Anaerolineales bacterium]
MGFFGNLDPEAYDRTYSDKDLVRRLVTYFRPHRRNLALLAGGVTVTGALDVIFPIILARVVNGLAEHPDLSYFFSLLALVLFTGVLSWLVNFLRRRLTARVIGEIVYSMRRDAFRATVAHDLSFYDEFRTGRIVSRITSDTAEFASVTTLVIDTISQFTVVLVLTAILFTLEWRLTLALLVMTPFIMFVALAFRRLARYVTRQGNRAMANVNAAIQETVAGIAVAKNFRQESTVYTEFAEVNKQSYTINLRRGFVLANVFPVMNALGGVAVAVLVYLGGYAAGGGLISPGAWYLFIESVDRFFFPFTNLASFWSQIQAGLSATERVFALIDAESAVKQTGHEPVPTLRGDIEFDHLNFRYSAQETVLTDFSLHIRPGETVALVGHTGAGKSSIAKLIARFYEFQDGALRIDGRDIRSFDLHAYRRHLGLVSQSPFLFSGSVADNIRYTLPSATDAEIEALARQIGRGEWLATLPDGLASAVGERGGRLSMGQRQLVALMRVLVQRPAIFILDEATASIDPFTEEQIQEALDLILGKSTAIIIAHRLSTVRNADRIIVLRQGRIIEEGTHDALLAQGGHYAELYNTYFRHQSLEAIGEYGKLRATAAAD